LVPAKLANTLQSSGATAVSGLSGQTRGDDDAGFLPPQPLL